MRDDNAVEKQNDLGALAQHRNGDDDRQRTRRLVTGEDGAADRKHFLGDLAAVARHPDVMPAEHDRGEDEHAGVEQLLAAALEQFGENTGECRNDARADEARTDAAGNQEVAPGHSLRHRKYDADDQAGFDDFAENDEQRTEHWRIFVPLKRYKRSIGRATAQQPLSF